MLACAESNFSTLKFEYLHKNEFVSITVYRVRYIGSINEKKPNNLVTLYLLEKMLCSVYTYKVKSMLEGRLFSWALIQ